MGAETTRSFTPKAKEAFQLIQEAKEVLTNATRPFYKLEESPFQEEKQKALAAKAELRKKQFFIC